MNAKGKITQVVLLIGFLLHTVTTQAQTGFSTHRIISGGETREYLLYVPESYNGQPMPLVFSFHGSGGEPRGQVATSGFDRLAEQHGFLVAFPAGAFTNSITARSWNANMEAGVDDVQFVHDMITAIAGERAVDRSRIYTSGFSGGARISSRLACELSDVLAAAAPVAGLQYPDDCTLKRAIPMIAFHALDDQVNTYQVMPDSRPYWRMGVETALDKWRQANGCTLTNTADRLAQGITLYIWTDCRDGAQLHFYQTETGNHTWPGADQNRAIQDIQASSLIWAFFSRHRLP